MTRREKRIEETREIVAAMRCDSDHHEDETPEELRESAYRRGVEHGLQMAREAVTHYILVDGTALDSRLRLLARHVSDWRYRKGKYRTADRAKVQRPPWP